MRPLKHTPTPQTNKPQASHHCRGRRCDRLSIPNYPQRQTEQTDIQSSTIIVATCAHNSHIWQTHSKYIFHFLLALVNEANLSHSTLTGAVHEAKHNRAERASVTSLVSTHSVRPVPISKLLIGSSAHCKIKYSAQVAKHLSPLASQIGPTLD